MRTLPQFDSQLAEFRALVNRSPRNLGPLVVLASTVLAIMAAQASCTEQPKSPLPAHTLGCDNVSPSEYYLANEFQRDNPADQLEAFSRLRNFDPDDTLRVYSPQDLACWVKKSDPIAGYLAAASHLGSANVLVVDDDLAGRDLPPEALEGLRLATQPRRCATDAERRILFCETGLPEAEYLLSIVIRQRPDGLNQSRELLNSSARKGLFVADQLRQSDLLPRDFNAQ